MANGTPSVPGNPHPQESYSNAATASQLFEASTGYAYQCYNTGEDLFHRNVRTILKQCWPVLSFAEQMRRTWINESVLCSAEKEGGTVPAETCRECGERYLRRQLALFNNALIVALGSKAKARAKGISGIIAVASPAPPGCNKKESRESWNIIPDKWNESF